MLSITTSSLLLPLLLLHLLLLQSATASRRPPTFVFDYAKDAASRWDGALQLALQGKTFEETFGAIFRYHNNSLFDSVTPDTYHRITRALVKNFPEQAEELKGIAAQFQEVFPDQVVSYEYLATWVYFHELKHADLSSNAADKKDKKKNDGRNDRLCTGLLAADSSQSVHHVANMDQSPPQVRDVTLHVKYIDSRLDSEEQVLFQGVDWYWFNTGTTRMVMKGVASIQENWRRDHEMGPIPMEDILNDIENGVQSHVLVFRYAFEKVVREDPTIGYEELLEHMSRVRLAAPEYIVMAGPKPLQGAVLARNQTGVAAPGGKILHLGESDGNPTSANNSEITSWALVQTNYDHWTADNPEDPRRTVAEQTLANFGQDIAATSVGLYAVASTYPVHATSTAYTAVMNAKTGDLLPFVRTMMCPVGDADCLKNAEAHGYGFGVGGGTQKNGNLRASSMAAETKHMTLHSYVTALLAVALLFVLGLLFKSKSDVRSQYKAVPNAANGSR